MRRCSVGLQHFMVGIFYVLLEFFERLALPEDPGNLYQFADKPVIILPILYCEESFHISITLARGTILHFGYQSAISCETLNAPTTVGHSGVVDICSALLCECRCDLRGAYPIREGSGGAGKRTSGKACPRSKGKGDRFVCGWIRKAGSVGREATLHTRCNATQDIHVFAAR